MARPSRLESLYQRIDEAWGSANPQLFRVRRCRDWQRGSEDCVLKIFHSWSTIQDCRQKFAQWTDLPGHHTVPAEDFGLWSGAPAMVFRHIDGISLRELLAEDTLSLDEVVELVAQVELGLVELAECGLCHGDLSLGNILVDRSGHVKLIDYDSFGDHREIRATPQFVAPEVWLGAMPSFASDLFSLGLLKKYLTGELPMLGRCSLATLRQESLKWVDESSPWLHPDPLSRRALGSPSLDQRREQLAWRVRSHLLRKNLQQATQELEQKTQVSPVRRRMPRWYQALRWGPLLLMAVLTSDESRAQQKWGEISIRTRQWIRARIGQQDFGYAPVSLRLHAGQYQLEWQAHQRRGHKLLTVRGGEHNVIGDDDLFSEGDL